MRCKETLCSAYIDKKSLFNSTACPCPLKRVGAIDLTIREKLNYYPDVIEAQLAHKPIGPLGSAYDRAQFLDKRKDMMQDWADFLERNGAIF